MKKQEILNKYVGEDKILVAKVLDKIELSKNKITYTDFLDPHQKQIIQKLLSILQIKNVIFYGGYRDSERTILIIYPKKYSDNIIQKNYKNIMKVINIKLPKELKEKYKHRDYLSSLIRLGIKREKIGDIIVQDQEADIIILKEISEYVKTNIVELTRFKKSIVEIVEINKISKAKTKREKIQLIVSSLRLDNLVKELTNTSRNKAEEIILKGRVFVNFENILKLSKILKQGDIVTIRGKGRFQIIEEIGNTRKDKKIIEIEKYV
ncbi:MAG: hypothetical protein HFJ53_00650 [Clostridia bacterium]|jgi:RNA-binding protein YlmH|nr:hypothetical protein [Clostridia bacterium]